MRKNTTSINVLHFNGEDCTNGETKANILNNRFASVLSKDNQAPLPHMPDKSVPNIPKISVTVDGVYNLLANLDAHKATGPYNIPSRLLKDFAFQY